MPSGALTARHTGSSGVRACSVKRIWALVPRFHALTLPSNVATPVPQRSSWSRTRATASSFSFGVPARCVPQCFASSEFTSRSPCSAIRRNCSGVISDFATRPDSTALTSANAHGGREQRTASARARNPLAFLDADREARLTHLANDRIDLT